MSRVQKHAVMTHRKIIYISNFFIYKPCFKLLHSFIFVVSAIVQGLRRTAEYTD